MVMFGFLLQWPTILTLAMCPPFVHDIYNPGHHADPAFFAAAKFGVRQHHWPYGNMPPQLQVSDDQVAAIVRYVREVQLVNGIKYQPHHM